MRVDEAIRKATLGKRGHAENVTAIKIQGGDTISAFIGTDAVAIIGYGHAVYAVVYDPPETVLFTGWDGYSNTTSTHMNTIRSEVPDGVLEEVDAQPKTDDLLSLDELRTFDVVEQ